MTAAELKAARKRLALTQVQFAEALGVSASRLHDWERGADRMTGAACPVPRAIALATEALLARAAVDG